MYKCLRCGRVSTFEDISEMPLKEYAKRTEKPRLRCPGCSYRIFKKLKSGVKTVGAR